MGHFSVKTSRFTLSRSQRRFPWSNIAVFQSVDCTVCPKLPTCITLHLTGMQRRASKSTKVVKDRWSQDLKPVFFCCFVLWFVCAVVGMESGPCACLASALPPSRTPALEARFLPSRSPSSWHCAAQLPPGLGGRKSNPLSNMCY